ncbi:MAG TPA: hypothetical protein VLK89_05795 [Solirubrobacterales bacterium]|nr:hypothetical protein [Solirubrobacterales bacterium]
MTRKAKLLGLAALAILSVGATVTPAASAAEGLLKRPYWFKSDGSMTTTLTGTQVGENEFETDTYVIKCKTITYSGTMAGETTTTLTVTPTFNTCSTIGGNTATVETNGCSYTYHTDEQTGEETSPIIHDWFNAFDTTTTIECPTTTIDGKKVTDEIKIKISNGGVLKCTIDIPEQNAATGALFKEANMGALKDISVTNSFSKITYTETAGTPPNACTEGKDTTNGKYRGSTTFTGDNLAGEPTSIWVDPLS